MRADVTNSERGNTKTYTLSHLKREDPALFQRVCAGELSANAAAIAAARANASEWSFKR